MGLNVTSYESLVLQTKARHQKAGITVTGLIGNHGCSEKTEDNLRNVKLYLYRSEADTATPTIWKEIYKTRFYFKILKYFHNIKYTCITRASFKARWESHII